VSVNASVKDIIEKIGQRLDSLSEEMKALRADMEKLAEESVNRLKKVLDQSETLIQLLQQEVSTFEEQRHLLESQITAELDRVKRITQLSDLEDAVHTVSEIIDEFVNKIDLDKVLEAVQQLEAQQRSSSEGG
jgi:chromosome segregation ATPase